MVQIKKIILTTLLVFSLPSILLAQPNIIQVSMFLNNSQTPVYYDTVAEGQLFSVPDFDDTGLHEGLRSDYETFVEGGTVLVPDGAIDQNLVIEANVITNPEHDAVTVIEYTVNGSTEKFHFNTPAHLSLPYDETKIGEGDEEDLVFGYWDDSLETWDITGISNINVDTENDVVDADVIHLSTIGVVLLSQTHSRGDVDDDKKTTATDASIILRYVVGLVSQEDYPNLTRFADVSRDGSISAYDAALIMQYVAGLISEF